MAAPRAIQSLTISFGLVSIPVKVYTAASSQTVRFNMLSKKSKSRVKQQLYDPALDEVVDRKDTDQGVRVREGAVRRPSRTTSSSSWKRRKSSMLDIVEFVPLESVDLVYVEKSYYLGPDKGGNKAYQLLSESMHRTGKIAVGQFTSRGKEQLVLVRPYRQGLILHQVYYSDEVRAFDDVDLGDRVELRPGEADLADQLIEQLTETAFDPEKYKDAFRQRVLEAVGNEGRGRADRNGTAGTPHPDHRPLRRVEGEP